MMGACPPYRVFPSNSTRLKHATARPPHVPRPRVAWAWARSRSPACCSRACSAPRRPARSPASRGIVNPLHFAPKAKRVIFLCMAGGPSQLETFDYKPKLAAMHGQPMPESFTKGQPIAQLQGKELRCLRPAGQVRPPRPIGPGDQRAAAAHRQRSPTTSASSARCRPSRSITTRPTRS